MGGGGGKINKPRAAKASVRKRTREKKRSKKRPRLHSNGTLSDTTLRQCRSNPKANVRLSGKKKRKLAREAKRLLADKAEMEVVALVKCSASQPAKPASDISTMDIS